jgi:ABC-type sugar transport system ATPase subunit
VIGINNIGLDIAPGELLMLKGNSGSGKSTFLSLIAGLDRPTRGYLNVADSLASMTICLKDEAITDQPSDI